MHALTQSAGWDGWQHTLADVAAGVLVSQATTRFPCYSGGTRSSGDIITSEALGSIKYQSREQSARSSGWLHVSPQFINALL